jgi:hypothetical protein
MDSISAFFLALSIISGIGAIIMLFIVNIDHYEEHKEKRLYIRFRIFMVMALFFGITNVFIPTTKQCIMIYAGGKTLDYIESDTSLQQIPSKSTEIILNKLNEYLKETNHENIRKNHKSN